MNIWTRYTEIDPTEQETAELERRGSGMVQRDGRDICLLAQTDTVTWGIPDVHGTLMVAEIGSIPLDAQKKISEIATVIDDSYAQGFVVRADDETMRRRIRRIAQRERGGTAPNASLILTAEELAFIDERFGGSKSAAIHAALAALKRSE
jgi:hypothetical protein